MAKVTKPLLYYDVVKRAWVMTDKGGRSIFELPQRFNPPMVDTQEGDPGRQMYLQRTHRGTITAGKSLTGLMIAQTFKGTGNSGNLDGAEIKVRGDSTDTAFDVDGMRAIVANCDAKKTDVSGIARGIEAVLENSNGGTITEARCINAKIQTSGGLTTGYVGYFEGHSAVYADYGLYIRYCDIGLFINAAAVTTAIEISGTLAATSTRALKSLVIQATPNHGDGYGVHEFDLTPSGQAGGHFSCISCWINIVSGVTLNAGGAFVTPRNDGVYQASGSTVTGAKIVFGGRMQAILNASSGWQQLTVWSIHSNQTITALIEAGSITYLGFVSGTSGAATGSIPFSVDSNGGVKYIRVYDAT